MNSKTSRREQTGRGNGLPRQVTRLGVGVGVGVGGVGVGVWDGGVLPRLPCHPCLCHEGLQAMQTHFANLHVSVWKVL